MTDKAKEGVAVSEEMTPQECRQVACGYLDVAAAEIMELQELIETQSGHKLSGAAFLAYEQAMKSIYEWLQCYEEHMGQSEGGNDKIPGQPVAFYQGGT